MASDVGSREKQLSALVQISDPVRSPIAELVGRLTYPFEEGPAFGGARARRCTTLASSWPRSRCATIRASSGCTRCRRTSAAIWSSAFPASLTGSFDLRMALRVPGPTDRGYPRSAFPSDNHVVRFCAWVQDCRTFWG